MFNIIKIGNVDVEVYSSSNGEQVRCTSQMQAFRSAGLEAREIHGPGWLVTIEYFLKKYATFKKISSNTYLIGNRGTGILDKDGNIKEKSELRKEFSGKYENSDDVEEFGNLVFVLVVV